MIAIQQALQERRQRLEELEKKLAAAGGESSTLKRTVSNLKAQIAEQQTENRYIDQSACKRQHQD